MATRGWNASVYRRTHRDWDVGDLGQVLSFVEGAAGELYVLSRNGSVYRLEPDGGTP